VAISSSNTVSKIFTITRGPRCGDLIDPQDLCALPFCKQEWAMRFARWQPANGGRNARFECSWGPQAGVGLRNLGCCACEKRIADGFEKTPPVSGVWWEWGTLGEAAIFHDSAHGRQFTFDCGSFQGT
jgi:hypothetical protein